MNSVMCAVVLAGTVATMGCLAAPCLPGAAAGSRCDVLISALHPTQFAVGLREVERKRREILGMSPRELESFLVEKTAPVVVGPDGVFYLVDHHHTALALEETNTRRMNIEIVQNWSDLVPEKFWAKMKESNFVNLIDEHGVGPRPPSELPKDLRHCADDPYRSLAGVVREKIDLRRSGKPFEEFVWADKFRSKKLLEKYQSKLEKDKRGASEKAWKEAVKKAAKLQKKYPKRECAELFDHFFSRMKGSH